MIDYTRAIEMRERERERATAEFSLQLPGNIWSLGNTSPVPNHAVNLPKPLYSRT